MADDKIRITWDEIHNPAIDAAVKQQGVLTRTQEHFQQQQAHSAFLPSPAQRSGIWYNIFFYMGIFGLIGGFIAWGLAEIVMQVGKTDFERYQELVMNVQRILSDRDTGRISDVQAKRALDDLEKTAKTNPYVKVLDDRSLSPAEVKSRIDQMGDKDQRRMFVVQMLFFAVSGTCIAFWLACAEPLVTRNLRGVVVNGMLGAALGLAGGLVVSLFINALYQALGGGRVSPDAKPNIAGQIFARAVGWGVLGLFLRIAPGIALRNWKKLLIGLAGGLIGGTLGGVLFDPIGMLTESDVLSRIVAFVAIGVVTGLSTGLIENVAKSGWLRVVAGLIAGKQFILYRNPTYIGSSPQCEVYLFKDPKVSPRHAAVHLAPGGFELEDLSSATGTFVNGQLAARVRLHSGDQVQIGSTCLVFQEKAGVGFA